MELTSAVVLFVDPDLSVRKALVVGDGRLCAFGDDLNYLIGINLKNHREYSREESVLDQIADAVLTKEDVRELKDERWTKQESIRTYLACFRATYIYHLSITDRVLTLECFGSVDRIMQRRYDLDEKNETWEDKEEETPTYCDELGEQDRSIQRCEAVVKKHGGMMWQFRRTTQFNEGNPTKIASLYFSWTECYRAGYREINQDTIEARVKAVICELNLGKIEGSVEWGDDLTDLVIQVGTIGAANRVTMMGYYR